MTTTATDIAESVWLGSDKKGSYERLLTFPHDVLAALGEEPQAEDGHVAHHPKKGPLLYFDFVEFYGGSGRVSACVRDLGFSVAPPLDLDSSQAYDLSSPRLLEWAMMMIESGRFGSFLTEPPRTTFSQAAHPALRSYQQPNGYDPTEPRTRQGNLLAHRSFVLHGRRRRRPCGKEQPYLSKMIWMRAWACLRSLGFEEAVVASCQFSSPRKKQFRFLLWEVDAQKVTCRCPGGHEHLKVEGRYTKGSAVYTWELAKHLAEHFGRAIKRLSREDEAPSVGYESVITNDLLTASRWQLGKVWQWKKRAHINVLEASAGLAVLKHVALKRSHVRFNSLFDSRVAKGALSKGRTAAGLQRLCKIAACFQLCADVYPGWSFAPTRLNVSDDPTRDCYIREPSLHGFSDLLTVPEIQMLHASAVNRPLAGWIRLVILVSLFLPSSAASATDRLFDFGSSFSGDHLGVFTFHPHGDFRFGLRFWDFLSELLSDLDFTWKNALHGFVPLDFNYFGSLCASPWILPSWISFEFLASCTL